MNNDELIRNDCHPWCRCTARDEAVRAAEDGRQGPLPTLEEVIDGAKAMMAGPSGLRTKRVTLEITHYDDIDADCPRCWNWTEMLSQQGLGINESVRVVEAAAPAGHRGSGVFDANGDEVPWEGVVAALKDERDAAIRELDELRTECERLRGKVAAMEGQSRMDIEREIAVEEAWESCEIRPHWPDDEPGTSHRYAKSMRLEIVRLRARLADLKSQLESAPAASGAATEPVAWGVVARGIVLATSTSRSDAVDMQSEYAIDTVVVPLYASPPPARGWLTEEERELIAGLTDDDDYTEEGQNIAKALLARSTPPEVELPPMVIAYDDMDMLKEALAAAGVKVKEAVK